MRSITEEIFNLKGRIKQIKETPKGLTYPVALQTFFKAKELISLKKTSWKELGVNEKQLNHLVTQIRVNEINEKTRMLFEKPVIVQVFNNTKRLVAEIKEAVFDGVTSWEDLGKREEDLDELVIEVIKHTIAILKQKGTYTIAIEIAVDDIINGVKNDIATWSELETSSEKVEELRKKALGENEKVAVRSYCEIKKTQERMRKILAYGADAAKRVFGSEF
jgi:hypothetical protein